MYKLNRTFQGFHTVTRLADNASIPFDEGNSDYLKYLEWLAEGNTPEPAQTQAEMDAEANAKALVALHLIDIGSIRAIREYIAAKPDAPQVLKDREAAAAVERSKLKGPQ